MTKFSDIRLAIIVKSIFIALCVFGTLLTSTEACDGYKIKVNKLEPCDKSGTIKLTNPKVELMKDCHVMISGCADFTAGFSSLKLAYDVKKKGMMVPFKGERDACEELAKQSKQKDVADKLKQYKINKNCPVQAVKACSQKGEKIDVSSFKDKFRLAAGQYTGTVTLQANSGNSCFKFDIEFKRGK